MVIALTILHNDIVDLSTHDIECISSIIEEYFEPHHDDEIQIYEEFDNQLFFL